MDAWFVLLRDHGTWQLDDILEFAIGYARHGHPIVGRVASTIEAVTLEGRIYAVPWFLDVGLLYYRTDLVPRAPKTYAELQSFARAAMARDPALAGYLWQGRQYEGLNCNVFEAVWGHGGDLLRDGRIALDTDAARAGLHPLLHRARAPGRGQPRDRQQQDSRTPRPRSHEYRSLVSTECRGAREKILPGRPPWWTGCCEYRVRVPPARGEFAIAPPR